MGKQLKFQWGWDVPPPIDYKLYIKKLKTKKMAYKTPTYTTTSLNSVETYEGETMELKIGRILNAKEPIKEEGIQLIYSERKKGVLPETNIRADRWEIATDAMNAVSASKIAKRENKFSILEGGKNEPDGNSNMAENSGGL